MEKSYVTDDECCFRLRGAMLTLPLALSGSVCVAPSAPWLAWDGPCGAVTVRFCELRARVRQHRLSRHPRLWCVLGVAAPGVSRGRIPAPGVSQGRGLLARGCRCLDGGLVCCCCLGSPVPPQDRLLCWDPRECQGRALAGPQGSLRGVWSLTSAGGLLVPVQPPGLLI